MSMAIIETARGPVDAAQLGPTLMHEHVFVLDFEVFHNYPEEWGDEEQRVASAVARMNELKSRGVGTIVDLTVMGLGRYMPRIARVAAQTELNIIVATGFYTYDNLPFYFHYRGPDTVFGGPEPLVDMFVRDITKGIADTGIKAGILKCATDVHGVTKDIDRILRATAQAHRQTGIPISTHTAARRKVGLDQQRIFREEGVDLARVVIGHSGDTTDLAYLEELIANGSYIGMDRFGIDTILSFEDRVNTVAEMCRRGHASHMVLSHDAACFNHWLPEAPIKAALPRWNYMHIHNDVVPALKAKGVTDEQIDTMLIENPRRIFSTQGGY
jgi:phosphotriesterase-related protein